MRSKLNCVSCGAALCSVTQYIYTEHGYHGNLSAYKDGIALKTKIQIQKTYFLIVPLNQVLNMEQGRNLLQILIDI